MKVESTWCKNRARTAIILLVVANLVLPAAILVFAMGFFPYKPFLSGFAQYEDMGFRNIQYTEQTLGDYADIVPKAPFNKVVFMVVDALRSDFVFMEGMGFEYTQSLIRNGVAVPFTAHATSPTITMPRIKAITTGSTPSFIDVILNFDETDTTSSLASQDTWLAQLKAKQSHGGDNKGGGKLLMYGDDTWLKLFPGTFDRADGTSSFFVSDFTEVDNNVTRHISDELKRDDWSAMVLHYLGLDHIGHKAGPRSPNMLPKQREMDAIVREIYEAITSYDHLRSTLLVLCGDHGMNDAGNHGASSPGETSPALVFMSPKFEVLSQKRSSAEHQRSPLSYKEDFRYYSKVDQSDLVPTLAALLGFPVPKNNLGSFITEFFPLWPDARDHANILRQNALQILNIIRASFPSANLLSTSSLSSSAVNCSVAASEAENLACRWHVELTPTLLSLLSPSEQEAWLASVISWLHDAQALMTNMASNYNVFHLTCGMLLAVVAVGTSAAAMHMSSYASCSVAPGNLVVMPFVLTILPYGVMMFASSYVEEEHQFWHWIAVAYVTYLSRHSIIAPTSKALLAHSAKAITSLIMALLCLRLMRGWNTTGQKYASDPSLLSAYVLPHPDILWSLVLITHAYLFFGLAPPLSRLAKSPFLGVAWSLVPLIACFVFKVSFTYEDAPELVEKSHIAAKVFDILGGWENERNLVARARLAFGATGMLGVYAMHNILSETNETQRADALDVLLGVCEVFACLQTRTGNLPLFVLLAGLMRWYLEGLFFSSSPISSHQEIGEQSQGTQNNEMSITGHGVLENSEHNLAVIVLQHVSFFAFGGSNAISSIDLSNAYNGISEFNIVAVAILTFFSNWAAPVMLALWEMRILLKQRWLQTQKKRLNREAMDKKKDQNENNNIHFPLIESKENGGREGGGKEAQQEQDEGESTLLFVAHLSQQTLFASGALTAVTAACTLLRTHLFVWTVFSPKFLYAMAWCLGQHLGVNVVLCGALWWVGVM